MVTGNLRKRSRAELSERETSPSAQSGPSEASEDESSGPFNASEHFLWDYRAGNILLLLTLNV
jgi:hypothetical protein